MTWLIVNFQCEGFHKYPEATGLFGVEFLANQHRHLFHIRVELTVNHNDRELEFILIKRDLQKKFDYEKLSNRSCEVIAQDIVNYMIQIYGYQRQYRVTVLEDGENGARVEG